MAEPESTAPETGPGEIVVGVDDSPSSLCALRWAVRQASLTGSRVRAVIAWPMPVVYGPKPVPRVWVDWAAMARAALDDAVRAALPAEQVPSVATEVVEGGAARVLLDAAKDAELLVVGSRGTAASPGCSSAPSRST